MFGVLAVDLGAGRAAARATVLAGLVDHPVGGIGRGERRRPVGRWRVGGHDVALQADGVGTVPHVSRLGLEGLVGTRCFQASEHGPAPGALRERIDRLLVVHRPIPAGGCNTSGQELVRVDLVRLSRSSQEADDWAAFTAATPPPGRPNPHRGGAACRSPGPVRTLSEIGRRSWSGGHL